MTAKQTVRDAYPSARCLRREGIEGKKYYAVIMAGATSPFSVGETPIEAWRKAKKKLTVSKAV